MTYQEIKTDRLLLRRWQNSDLNPFCTMCTDPDVMKHIASGQTMSAQQVARDIAKYESEWDRNGYGIFAIQLRSSGKFVGYAGLSDLTLIADAEPAVEIGWRLAREYWGKGLASEAAEAALAFGLNKCKLSNIVSICQIANTASERIMRKLGLVFDHETIAPDCGRTIKVYRLPQI